MGVVTGPATRITDAALQADLLRQNATVAGLQTTQTALAAIDTVNGTPGQGNDLGSLLGQSAESVLDPVERSGQRHPAEHKWLPRRRPWRRASTR